MSRAYSIRVSESIREHVHVADGVQTRLEVLAILSEEEMAELVAAELIKLGFECEDDVLTRKGEDGVEISVDAKTATITVRLEAESEVDESIERQARIYEEALTRGTEQLRNRVNAELKGRVEAEREKLTGEVAATLEAKLRDLRRELDGAATRATAEALKIRAAQLGEIQQIDENAETGELTVKVKV